MKCIVPIKQVLDPYINIRVRADNSGVETANQKKSLNPFDEIAVEEAVRLKEKGIVTEIIALTIGTTASQEILRQALAMGADSALLVLNESNLSPLKAANLIAKICKQHNPNFVIMGKQSTDSEANQVGQMLAGILNWSQATFASQIDFIPDLNAVNVVREVDSGLETLRLKLPAVITTDLRLNEPRYISLPNVMQAKKKQITTMQITDDTLETMKILEVLPPKKRTPGKKVSSVEELLDLLQKEAKVI